MVSASLKFKERSENCNATKSNNESKSIIANYLFFTL